MLGGNLRNGLVVVMVLAVTGWLRMPYEHGLSSELVEARLLTPAFDREARAGLSQKGFVASFGSLRPTLAALSAISTTRYHGRQDWEGLEEALETTVLLDPYNPHYWDLGGWHLAYNASSSYQEDEALPPLTRRKLFRDWIMKGDHFYERGIQANPQNLKLRQERARMWASGYKIQNFAKVVEILEGALRDVEMGEPQRWKVKRDLFYTLLRLPERRQEAYELAREIFVSADGRRYPSLVNGLCALQLDPRVVVKEGERLSMMRLYGDRRMAQRWIENYLKDSDTNKPRVRMEGMLRRLMAVAD